jgi:hypothetical protein
MARDLQLRIPPEWEAIDRVRDQVIAFLREDGEQDGVVDSVAMVVTELTENAIKYGRFDAADQVAVRLWSDSGAIIVEVSNPSSPQDLPQLNRLDRTIQWIRGFQDPFEAYLTRLREVSLQSPESRESGLGLVRVAYEGESSLDFFLGEGSQLSVSAVYRR